MTSERRGTSSPYWKRLQAVMKVQMGLASAAEAARELGISRQHYYRLEEEVLSAALGAATPRPRGRKKPAVDPALAELAQRLKQVERDRELLTIRTQHLEEANQALKLAIPAGEKRGRARSQRRSRPPLSGGVQAADPGAGPGAAGERTAGDDAV